MAAPTHDSAPGLAGHSRHRVLTWLMMFFGIPVPLGIVVAFVPQLRRIGEVSHWPWGDYGFFGWWLVPLSFAVAAVCAGARPGESRGRGVRVLAILAIVTTAALFVNP